MLKALRGLVLATGVAALPAFAQVDCPTEDSIDRYAQTARDALAALDGLVPESQQRALESRYAAMFVLKWSWQGRDAVTSDAPALDRLATCLSSGPCDAEASERSRNLGQFPSDRLFTWARVELGCQPAAPEIVDEPAEPEDDETVGNEPAPVASPEPAESEIETPVVETEVFEPIEAPEPAIEVVEQEAELPEPEIEDITTLAPPPNEGAATGSHAAMRTATLLLMKGNLSRAADIVRKACFVDAATTDPAATCESLFDVYHRMATRANPEEFLDFTNQLCTLNYERGCTSMARYFGADTTFEALLAAFNHYNRSCDSGDAEACAIVSDYHVAGRISAADLVKHWSAPAVSDDWLHVRVWQTIICAASVAMWTSHAPSTSMRRPAPKQVKRSLTPACRPPILSSSISKMARRRTPWSAPSLSAPARPVMVRAARGMLMRWSLALAAISTCRRPNRHA